MQSIVCTESKSAFQSVQELRICIHTTRFIPRVVLDFFQFAVFLTQTYTPRFFAWLRSRHRQTSNISARYM